MTDQTIQSYLATQRAHGRAVVLAFPALFPREVLTAFDLAVYEVWAPRPDSSAPVAAAMQPYLCPTVRGARAMLAQGSEGAIAAVIPHTCDSMQGLAAISLDLAGSAVPVVTFRHPRGGERASARVFLRAELHAFIASFERLVGRSLRTGELERAVDLHQGIDRSLRRILRNTAHRPVPDTERYSILRKREWMRPQDFAFELHALEKKLDHGASTRPGVPRLLSGMVPEPPDLIEVLEQAGGFVAVDDYACVGRRVPLHDLDEADPIERIVSRLVSTAPCPTRTADPWVRVRYLRERAQAAGARGVILHTVKFCEPELFDVPVVRRGLEQAGLKVLHIETEFEPRVPGQLVTRIEAFLEMLSGGGA